MYCLTAKARVVLGRCGPRKNPVLNVRSSSCSKTGPLWFLILVFLFCCFFWYTGLGRHPLVFVVKFYVECNQNHVWGPLGAWVMIIFADLRETSRIFAELRGPSRTFADISRTSRGSLEDPIATTRGNFLFVSWDTIQQIIIVRGYLLNRNCPKWGPFFNRV